MPKFPERKKKGEIEWIVNRVIINSFTDGRPIVVVDFVKVFSASLQSPFSEMLCSEDEKSVVSSRGNNLNNQIQFLFFFFKHEKIIVFILTIFLHYFKGNGMLLSATFSNVEGRSIWILSLLFGVSTPPCFVYWPNNSRRPRWTKLASAQMQLIIFSFLMSRTFSHGDTQHETRIRPKLSLILSSSP